MTQNPESGPDIIVPTRWWDWPSAVLVVLLMLTAAGRLVSTHWTDGLGVAMDFVFLGSILGIAIGLSSYHPILCVLISIAYGVLIIPWRLGATMIKGVYWDERLISMLGRAKSIIEQIIHQTDVTDSFLFVVLMGTLFWILSVNAGYVLTRYANAWRIILPTGLTIIIIHYYHNCPVVNMKACVNSDIGHGSSIIAIYLLLSLLLVARIYYIRQMRTWRQRHTFIHSDVSFDLMRVTVVAVVVVMALAWTAPAFGNKLFQNGGPLAAINRSYQSASKFFSHMFASLSFNAAPAAEFFSQGLSLGRGSEISYAMVLQVNAPQPSPTGGNYYWLARIYDRYQNGEWTSNYPFAQNYKAQQPIVTSPFIQGRQITTFDFYTYKNLGLLFAPAQIVSVSRPVTIYELPNPQGVPDVSLLELNTQMFSGERYQALSSLSTVSERELRAAGTDYPDWVTQTYLQVPADITPRTRALAKRIAAGLTDPYDIAQAVTQYLRENITYSRVIPPLPTNQEPIDWFLFDLKEGFCNYYATAEVIILRSLGIPARLAVGYAQGDPVSPQATPGGPPPSLANLGPQIYQVREKDSHAWPQVYFPGLGWIEFEPTSSIHEIQRPSGELTPSTAPQAGGEQTPLVRPTPRLDEPTPTLPPRPNAGNQGGTTTTTIIVVTIAVLIGLLDISILIWRVPMARRLESYFQRWGIKPPAFIQHWAAEEIHPIPARLEGGLRNIGIHPPRFLIQWALYSRLPPVGRAYTEINRALWRMRALPSPDATPAERASLLTELIPNSAEPVKVLLFEYHRGIYSPHTANAARAKLASQEIRKLSYMALFARFVERLGKPMHRHPQKAG